jgi:hypothetical protein
MKRATNSRSALNFLDDISKTNAHNLYAEGATNPRFFLYPAERGQTMIRRLFVLLLFSMVVIEGSASLRPTQSASPAPCTQDHSAWLKQVLEKMETIKPGMTRWDLLHVFRTEEGAPQVFEKGGEPPTGLRGTFVSQDCPYLKIDVEFKPEGVRNRDVIVKVSKPYAQSTTTLPQAAP